MGKQQVGEIWLSAKTLHTVSQCGFWMTKNAVTQKRFSGQMKAGV